MIAVWLRVATVSAALLVGACGSEDRSVTMTDGNGQSQTVTIKEDGGTTTIRSDAGTAEIKANADGLTGASFPPHAPQYPGSKVVSSATFAGKTGESGAMTVQETGDDVAKVTAFYKDRVKASGRKVALETATPDGGMLGVESEDGKAGMMIMFGRADNKTTITYMASQ